VAWASFCSGASNRPCASCHRHACTGNKSVGKIFSAAEYDTAATTAQMKSLYKGLRLRQPDGHSLLVNELKLQDVPRGHERELR